MTSPETFVTLLKDPAHWEFELFLMFLQDVLLGVVVYPLVKKHWEKYHKLDRFRGTLNEMFGEPRWAKRVGKTTMDGTLTWTNVSHYTREAAEAGRRMDPDIEAKNLNRTGATNA